MANFFALSFFKKKQMSFLVLFLVCISVCAGLFFPSTGAKADQATSSASVTNALPVASSVSIDVAAAAVTLVEGTTKTVTAKFTVTDNNGCSDIDAHATLKTKAVFYRTTFAGGAGCTPGNASCYTMSCTQDGGTCTPGGGDLAADYTCTAAVQFYADATDAGSVNAATDWTATAIPRDAAGTDGTTSADTIEMNSLTALDVTAAISYGALALGGNTGSADQTTVVTDTGNRQIDVQLSGYGASPADGLSMTCTIGTVTVTNEKYSLNSTVAYASRTNLTAAAFTETSFDLVQGVAATKNVYWGFGLPGTGVGGACTGIVVFAAING